MLTNIYSKKPLDLSNLVFLFIIQMIVFGLEHNGFLVKYEKEFHVRHKVFVFF